MDDANLWPYLAAPDSANALPYGVGQVSVGLSVAGETVDPDTFDEAPDELLAAAIDNLRREHEGDWESVETVPGMLWYAAGDGLAANRLLIPEVLFDEIPLAGVVLGVPSANHLLAVPLNSVQDLDALQVLVNAVHFAHGVATNPVTDQVFWYDGERLHHVGVTHDPSGTNLLPPPGLIQAIARLTAMGVVAVAGEA